jgi:hypothetical protein
MYILYSTNNILFCDFGGFNMRVSEVIISNKSAFIIYVNQQEYDDPSFEIKVNKYRSTCNDVSIFIDETQPMEEKLRKIIQENAY